MAEGIGEEISYMCEKISCICEEMCINGEEVDVNGEFGRALLTCDMSPHLTPNYEYIQQNFTIPTNYFLC